MQNVPGQQPRDTATPIPEMPRVYDDRHQQFSAADIANIADERIKFALSNHRLSPEQASEMAWRKRLFIGGTAVVALGVGIGSTLLVQRIKRGPAQRPGMTPMPMHTK